MKQLVTFLAAGALIFAGYKFHKDQVKSAADQAAAAARLQASREASRKKALQPQPSKPEPPKPQLEAIALSRALEPLYGDLFSSLNQNHPADLVPPLEITKERILDMQTHAEPERRIVYTQGITLLDAMISFAEERTKVLESLVRAAKGRSSLDNPATTSTSATFFAQTAMKRWEEEKNRRKPVLDQVFAQLRIAEREWNKRAGKDAPVEIYDFPDRTPVLINLDPPVAASNPLERRAYDQRRVSTYPWRWNYYNRYR